MHTGRRSTLIIASLVLLGSSIASGVRSNPARAGIAHPDAALTIGGTLYFTAFSPTFGAQGGNDGQELWKSDGTAEGTVLVKDIRPGPGGSGPALLTDVGGVLYFRANDGVHGRELWRSDGTDAGTVMVKDIVPGAPGSDPTSIVDLGGTVYFSPSTNGGIWKSDGTTDGTVQVSDFWTDSLFVMGSTLYFSTYEPSHQYELRKLVGTHAGTVLLADHLGRSPDLFTDVGSTLYFSAWGRKGRELWRSDGTPGGTRMVKDIHPGPNRSGPYWLTDVGGTLFFIANDGSHGYELWKSDGTRTGTIMVRDIRPGPKGGVGPLIALGSIVYFGGYDGTSSGLWKSDGTGSGTLLVKKNLSIGNLENIGETLYFDAYFKNLEQGAELWKSDGTSAGTSLVRDIRPGSEGSDARFLTGADGLVFFSANDGSHGDELWMSDGTRTGTLMVKDIWPGSARSAPFNLIFVPA